MKSFIEAKNVYLELPYETQGEEYSKSEGWLSALALTRTNFATVLSNVNFRADEGDRVGIMGLNGAGKTTLLRVLNGAICPTSGSVSRHGSLQSLISTMLGFNDYATVSENIVLRGTAMGLRYRQATRAMDEILDFSGLYDMAGRQLHTLSAGQRMRLGFAISTSIQPDILLMDEWIGTGDSAFVEKAKDRMLSRFNGSRISIIASHSSNIIRSLCNKALVLDKGRIVFYGGMDEGLGFYKALVRKVGGKNLADAHASDPLLFGDAMGAVEKVIVSQTGIEITGWAATQKKGVANYIFIDTPAGKFEIGAFQRLERQDVNDYLGKSSGAYGFRIFVPCGFIELSAADFSSKIFVYAGDNENDLGGVLPVVRSLLIEKR